MSHIYMSIHDHIVSVCCMKKTMIVVAEGKRPLELCSKCKTSLPKKEILNLQTIQREG